MPCTDVHDLDRLGGGQLADFSTDSHKNCPHEHEKDTCPPFCVCNCCGHVLATAKLVKWAAEPIVFENFSEKNGFHFAENWAGEFNNAIFQPPRA